MLKIRIVALLLLVVGAILGFLIYTSEIHPESRVGKFPFVLGLDLRGGTHLVYNADTSKVPDGDSASAMNSLRDVIERRVNMFGVSEALVQTERAGLPGAPKEDHLIVELPGITEIDKAVALIGATPTLEFRLVKPVTGTTSPTITAENFETYFASTGLTGRLLEKAVLEFSPNNEPVVSLRFNAEGKELFAKITREHVGEKVAIFLDGAMISDPVIREEISDGSAQISGGFTAEQARELVRNLNYGALPVPISLIGSQTIGPSLGEKALHASMVAGVLGFILVAGFLIFWYRLPGVVSVISLALYVVLNLALFKLIPVTLTAAGLAGFILSIGMAVDANILIFERTKEELKAGKDLAEAIRDGFARAWLSIRDSNLSSIITAVILYFFGGTAVIKGFALVFGLGVLVSMFTAITVSRTFLLALGFKGKGSLVRFLFSNGFSR